MNRDIRFRGLRVDGEGWVYGYYTKTSFGKGFDDSIVVFDGGSTSPHNVKPKTVGQFCGIKDRYDVDVYDGDILFSPYGEHRVKYVEEFMTFAIFTEEAWGWYCNGSNHFKYCHHEDNETKYFLYELERYEIQVINNIHTK